MSFPAMQWTRVIAPRVAWVIALSPGVAALAAPAAAVTAAPDAPPARSSTATTAAPPPGGAASSRSVVSSAAPSHVQAVTDVTLHAAPQAARALPGRVPRGTWFELRRCGVPAGWCEVVHTGAPAWVHAASVGMPVAPPSAIIVAPPETPIVIHVSPRRDSPR